mgnify:CR=1 FL=1
MKTNEDFQALVLKKLVSIEQNISAIEQNMSTKEDIAKIEKGIADIIATSDVTHKEVKAIRRDLRTIEAVTVKNWNDILELKKAE